MWLPERRYRMYRVVVPVDVDEERAAKQVETLLSLPADPHEIEAIVVHVHEEIDVAPDEAGGQLIDDINRDLPNIRGLPDSIEHFESEMASAGIAVERREIVADDTADAIVETARETDADSILLGVRGRSPVGKAVFGSVTQSVILQSDRPVIVAPSAN